MLVVLAVTTELGKLFHILLSPIWITANNATHFHRHNKYCCQWL